MAGPRLIRKRPIVVEAMQWDGTNATYAELQEWTHRAVERDASGNLSLWVEANTTFLDLELGEWILRDARGFYPCKADILAATYDVVPAEGQ